MNGQKKVIQEKSDCRFNSCRPFKLPDLISIDSTASLTSLLVIRSEAAAEPIVEMYSPNSDPSSLLPPLLLPKLSQEPPGRVNGDPTSEEHAFCALSILVIISCKQAQE